MMEFSEGQVSERGPLVEIRWKGGRVQRLSAAFLRAHCACALCRKSAIELKPEMFPGLEVASTEPVGAYAFQFHFSDGHSHGAYPFSTLERYPDEA